MDYRILIPVIIAFAISAVLAPVIIPVLRKLKMGQTEREDGVKSHLQKAGTPTMGGVIILVAIAITSLFYIKDYPNMNMIQALQRMYIAILRQEYRQEL